MQMGTGAHGHRAYGKKALGANGHRNKWGLGANWLLGKINWVKWAPGRVNEHLGKMDIWGKVVCYPKFPKGYPKCPVSISLNVCIWPPWQMGTRTFGGKGYFRCPNGVPQVPCVHFSHIFENGQWGKWAFEGRGYPKWSKSVPQMLRAHSPKIFANEQRGKLALGVLGKRELLRERSTLSASIMPIFPKWALGQNEHWGKWAPNAYMKNLGEMGTKHLGYFFPKCPFAPSGHLPQCPFLSI